jgi:putative membrane protein
MQKIENRVIAVVGIIYLVGIIGFLIPVLKPLFIDLTPLNILGSFVVAWIFHKKWEISHVVALAAIGIMGFFIEMLGVQTGLLFGSYHYGATLGPDWQGIPYLIGVNWAALVFFTSSILAPRVKSTLLRSLLGAALMTLYDFFMEPVAMAYDFWHWKNSIIPMQNYFAWFVFAFLFHLLLNSVSKPAKNRIASSLFAIQGGFFLVLYIFIQWIRT